MRRAEWFVKGLPAPQGSKKAFLHRHSGKVIMTESSGRKHKDWRDVVETESSAIPRFDGPVRVTLGFFLRRPRADFRANGEVKPKAPADHTKRPDVDKLARSVCDSLTDARVIEDDCKIIDLHVTKEYADDDVTGVEITVEEA